MSLWFSFHFWSRDLLRELDKKYEVLLIIFFLVFLLFLVSEGLLFVSFFWTSFHSLSSATLGTWPGEGFYHPDSCDLTFANTLLLSNAAISLGNAFISLEISSQFHIFFSLFSLDAQPLLFFAPFGWALCLFLLVKRSMVECNLRYRRLSVNRHSSKETNVTWDLWMSCAKG